jgi:hypothetical protein
MFLFAVTLDSASRSIGQMDGMMSALLAASLVTPQHLPTSQRFDLLVLVRVDCMVKFFII